MKPTLSNFHLDSPPGCDGKPRRKNQRHQPEYGHRFRPPTDGRVALPSRFLRPRRAFPAAIQSKIHRHHFSHLTESVTRVASESFCRGGACPRPAKPPSSPNSKSAFGLPRATRPWIASNRLRGHWSYENTMRRIVDALRNASHALRQQLSSMDPYRDDSRLQHGLHR